MNDEVSFDITLEKIGETLIPKNYSGFFTVNARIFSGMR